MDIKGKVAIVTGGASGLGRATVEALHTQGAKIVIADLDEGQGSALAKEMGDNVIFVKTDIGEEADNIRVCSLAAEKFGALHILINAAGIGGSRRIIGKESPYDLNWYKRIINVNLVGTFSMTCQAVWKMKDNQPVTEDGERGVVIHVSSVAGYEGTVGQVAYASTKAGINGMTIVMARELAREGIRVCTVAPGIVDTPLFATITPEAKASLGKQVPFPPRLGKPEEFAHLVKCIIENSYLNGEVIRMDGSIRMAAK